MSVVSIVGKKWDPGILDPGPFSGQIRKVEARLGKLGRLSLVDTITKEVATITKEVATIT